MASTLIREQPISAVVRVPELTATGSGRLDSVDLVRGIVMVVMALDHVRDYMNTAMVGPESLRFDAMNMDRTTPAYFFTRWVTHFCAPTFVFLAGTGAFLAGSRGKTKGQLSWFLLSRGLWLALLELTVVHLSWTFNWDLHQRGGAVIWAIGWSMVGLSLLVWLPTSAVAAFGVAVVAFHNQFDGIRAEYLTHGWIWNLLHEPGSFEWQPGYSFATPYPVLPWLGVMASGYGLGAMLLLERPQRRVQLAGLGLALIALFIGLRYFNQFGDPQPWKEQPRGWEYTMFSFLNCTKYPPSLMFVLMTLGPSITALAVFDRPIGLLGRPFVIFGRVPLFYYLLHLPLIHGIAVAIDYHRYGWSPIASWSIWALRPDMVPEDYCLSLPLVYAVWAGVILILFLPCYGFMLLKRKYPGGILSYL